MRLVGLLPVFFFVIVFVVGACDDGGRADRRAAAIDVAGAFVGAAGDVALLIENERDKNDVRLTFTRDAVPDVEDEFVGGFGFDARVVVVGDGVDGVRDEAVGGENVSEDGGASTVVDVDGEDIDVEGDDAVLRYSARLVGDAFVLEGVLRLSRRERRPRAGDSDGASTESEHVETALRLLRSE